MDDPLGVRASAEHVVQQARSVSINTDALAALSLQFERQLRVPEWNRRYHFGDGTPRTANYILLLDALNFSFWGEPHWTIEYDGTTLDGYWALAAGLKRAIEAGIDLTAAEQLATLDAAELGRILSGTGTIPMLEERAYNAREVGQVLSREFGGQCAHLVEAAQFDARHLVALIAMHFSSFRDEFDYHGERVRFYKRAQIAAADLYGAFAGAQWGGLANLDALTCFADYKLPQILRRFGALKYAPDLAERVDRKVEIPSGSDEEIEIRAATIAAVERLRSLLAERGHALNSVQIDWALWDAAQGAPPDGKPYHRTRTIYY